MKRTISLLFAACLILAACAVQGPAQAPREAVSAASEVSIASGQPEPESDPEPEPEADNSWQLDAPQSHGMDPALFEQLHAALAGSQIYAMVTAKDGVLIDEYYQEGYDESSVFALHSCSKSFTGALVGIAIEQGYFGGVDDLLSDYLPQVDSLEEGKRQLTLRHLLTHTSGLEWYEWGGGYSNWREFQSAENWVEYILGRSLVAQPGTLFNYSTGNTHLLSAALTAATGMDELQYAEENPVSYTHLVDFPAPALCMVRLHDLVEVEQMPRALPLGKGGKAHLPRSVAQDQVSPDRDVPQRIVEEVGQVVFTDRPIEEVQHGPLLVPVPKIALVSAHHPVKGRLELRAVAVGQVGVVKAGVGAVSYTHLARGRRAPDRSAAARSPAPQAGCADRS